ncbi:MAG: hypothetical protein GF313_13710 [Caldithrix sp.]|nr:hypothetical protein [Caldithrix sp.]
MTTGRYRIHKDCVNVVFLYWLADNLQPAVIHTLRKLTGYQRNRSSPSVLTHKPANPFK